MRKNKIISAIERLSEIITETSKMTREYNYIKNLIINLKKHIENYKRYAQLVNEAIQLIETNDILNSEYTEELKTLKLINNEIPRYIDILERIVNEAEYVFGEKKILNYIYSIPHYLVFSHIIPEIIRDKQLNYDKEIKKKMDELLVKTHRSFRPSHPVGFKNIREMVKI